MAVPRIVQVNAPFSMFSPISRADWALDFENDPHRSTAAKIKSNKVRFIINSQLS